jgi:DNA-directed RNA polymerase specialized sigma24 family protein
MINMSALRGSLSMREHRPGAAQKLREGWRFSRVPVPGDSTTLIQAMAIARHKTRQRELREARTLLRRVQRGEPRAFALLYAAYEGRLYRFCHRLTGDAETASALVQQTFARALADVPDAELETLDVSAYLYATARALAYERNGEPSGPASAGEHEVAAANQRLSPQERAVLALRDLEGRPDAEIASVLGSEESAVPGLLGSARLRLHRELGLPGAVAACAGRLPELSAHTDGTLPAERRAELEQHVARCAHCRAALFAMREATMRYRAVPVPEAPGELGERITAALGAVGLPARSSAAAEPVATGGRQTAVAVAMAGLAVVGVGVTIAAAHEDHDSGKPARAPLLPEPQPSAPAAGSSLMSAAIALAASRPHRPPPALHHVRAGALHAQPAPKPPSAAERLGLGKSFAPESPPAAPAPAPATPTPTSPAKPRSRRDIPVEVLPPTLPSSAQAAANEPPAPPPAPEPPPPTQTTST